VAKAEKPGTGGNIPNELEIISRPALAKRKTMDQPGQENLDFKVEKYHVPHPEFATEKIILGHQDPALKVKLQESHKEVAIC